MEIVSIDVDESINIDIPANQIAEILAQRKSEAYPSTRLLDNEILITADTIVVLDGKKLGKPQTRDEAVSMLNALSGKMHYVYTGVCLKTNQRLQAFTEQTSVHFKTLSQKEIDYYIDHFHPLDKAGAYGIQEWIGMIGIQRIEGCYYNVMGLPLARLYKEIIQIA